MWALNYLCIQAVFRLTVNSKGWAPVSRTRASNFTVYTWEMPVLVPAAIPGQAGLGVYLKGPCLIYTCTHCEGEDVASPSMDAGKSGYV